MGDFRPLFAIFFPEKKEIPRKICIFAAELQIKERTLYEY